MAENKNNGPLAGQPQQAVGVPPVVATPVSVTPAEHVDRSNDATSLANVRRHGTLGAYVKCIVHPTVHAQQNTLIFASINLYAIEFKPGIEVEIPEAIVTLLRNAATASHYYDPNALSEQGNKGAHLTKGVKKYIVEKV